jgi:hypothetical protein
MRRLRLIPAFLLVACSTDNNLFVLTQPSGGGTDASTGDPSGTTSSPTSTAPPTSDTGDPSAGSATTGSGGSAEESSTTAVSASEPDPGTTTTGDTSTGAPDPETGVETETETGEPLCGVTHAEGLDLQVYNKTKGGQEYTDCDGDTRTFYGKMMIVGADVRVIDAENCGNPEGGDLMILARLPQVAERVDLCVEAKIVWNKEVDGCQVGTLVVRDFVDPGKRVLLVGRFSHQADGELPIAPEPPQPLTMCGCPMGEPGCCEPQDAGDYGFPIAGETIAPLEMSDPFFYKNYPYVLHNVQAWVGPACVEAGDFRFDWFAQIASP